MPKFLSKISYINDSSEEVTIESASNYEASVAATGDTVPLRDENGRVKVAIPGNNEDAVNKGYMEDYINDNVVLLNATNQTILGTKSFKQIDIQRPSDSSSIHIRRSGDSGINDLYFYIGESTDNKATLKANLNGHATSATFASNADWASSSDYADYADLSDVAGFANLAGTAQYAQYASSDETKGTIEERLTELGFKQATFSSLNSNYIADAQGFEQGKIVAIEFTAKGSYTSSDVTVANISDITQPSSEITLCYIQTGTTQQQMQGIKFIWTTNNTIVVRGFIGGVPQTISNGTRTVCVINNLSAHSSVYTN